MGVKEELRGVKGSFSLNIFVFSGAQSLHAGRRGVKGQYIFFFRHRSQVTGHRSQFSIFQFGSLLQHLSATQSLDVGLVELGVGVVGLFLK